MFSLPIKSPLKPYITQIYGNKSNNDWYKANGINNAFHNGTDWVMGTPIQTYGTPLVSPFPEGAVVSDIVFDTPMSTKGNGVYVTSNLVGDTQYRAILWHTGEVAVTKGQTLKEGDLICYIGNSGLVSPAPTSDQPFNGSHLHFGLYKIKGGQYIYTPPTIMGETDPLLYFDQNQWYLGTDSGPTHDIEPLKWRWSLKGIKDWWLEFLDALTYFNGNR